MLISDEYRRQNAMLHEESSFYGVSGVKSFWVVKELAERYGDVLDYGCGKGYLGDKLRQAGIKVSEYDPAVKELSEEPVPADLVVCTDVMEHVEPECVDAVLDHIKSLARKAAFFVIAFEESKKFLPDGRNCHICLRSDEWWEEKLGARFHIKTKEPLSRGAMRYVVEIQRS